MQKYVLMLCIVRISEEWEDYINIYRVDSIDRIIEMNNKDKIPFCEYCLIKKYEMEQI